MYCQFVEHICLFILLSHNYFCVYCSFFFFFQIDNGRVNPLSVQEVYRVYTMKETSWKELEKGYFVLIFTNIVFCGFVCSFCFLIWLLFWLFSEIVFCKDVLTFGWQFDSTMECSWSMSWALYSSGIYCLSFKETKVIFIKAFKSSFLSAR